MRREAICVIILGIDPGIAIVGWGVVDYTGNKFTPIAYGSIQTPKVSSFTLQILIDLELLLSTQSLIL